MRIVLTAGQAVLAHGWLKAREYLTWGDVLNNDNLTFEYLHKTINLGDRILHSLQPDLQAWIKSKKVTVENCPSLSLWGAHPIHDFHSDLADMIRLRWHAEQYKSMGISYENLLSLGLTAETMMLFGFTLMNWMQIGFSRVHCDPIPDNILYRLFSMNKLQVLSCFK
jgi:hypothetical protein